MKRKILVIGHAYIAPINRVKWLNLSEKKGDLEIKVLIPKIWPQTFFNLKAGDLSKYKKENCKYHSLSVFNAGNEVLYGYNFVGLINLLRKFKPDLIHVEQGDNAFSYFQAIFFSKIFSPKSKFTFFTWVNWKNRWSIKYKIFWSFIERFNLRFSDGAIVGNNDAKKVLVDKGFGKKIEVLPQLGVDEAVFRPAVIDQFKKPKKIGYIGRFMQEKGLWHLVDAFDLIHKEYPEWSLVLVGSGKDEKKLKDYIENKEVKNFIEFVSPVSHEKVYALLQKFEIFVLPSYDTAEWREQFGHVLTEAMACKVPIIGSTGGHIADVIGNAGLVFKQKDITGLADCLKKLMSDAGLRKKLSEKGYKRFKEKFSYDFISKKTLSFWNKILGEYCE